MTRFGSVSEFDWEIIDEIERLIGGAAGRNNLQRQIMLINLLGVIETVQKRAHKMPADKYLKTINQLETIYRGIV